MPEEIYEQQYEQKTSFASAREKVNPDHKQRERANFYITKYTNLKAEMEEMKKEWEPIEKLYACDRDITDEDDPNSFDPIILPVIEGQTSAMTEKFISASVKGEGYADQKFAHTGQVLVDFAYRNIKIKSKVKAGARSYLLLGNGVFAFGWDPDALDGFGLPEWRCPQVTKVFVDGKIKNMADFQKAEFVIEEIGSFSILSARDEYGDDIADAITLGNTDPDFDGTVTQDDMYSFTKLHVWTRNNPDHNLQKLEYSLCGIELKASDPNEPYYEYVNNKYPYAFIGLYPKTGRFHRFGDGKLLQRLQVLINNLWDECVTACKFSAQATTFVDPSANLDPDQMDGDPSHPIIARNPRQNILAIQGLGINQVVFQLVSLILQEVQRITRFSSLMTGNAPGREITATQSGIMVQQGNSGIDDKRNDMSDGIEEGTQYIMGLMMEYWPAGKAIRITEDSEDIEWTDARTLKNVPAMVPADSSFERMWKAEHPDKPVPKYIQLETEKKDDNGIVIKDKNGISEMEPQTKKAEFDMQISIGEGMPTSKMALFNIIMSMSKMVLPDEVTGQPRSLLSYQQVQKLIEDIIGLPIMKIVTEAQNVTPIIPGGEGSGNVNQNIPTAQMPTVQNPYIEGAGGVSGLMSNQPMQQGG